MLCASCMDISFCFYWFVSYTMLCWYIYPKWLCSSFWMRSYAVKMGQTLNSMRCTLANSSEPPYDMTDSVFLFNVEQVWVGHCWPLFHCCRIILQIWHDKHICVVAAMVYHTQHAQFEMHRPWIQVERTLRTVCGIQYNSLQ